jgi:hypothetical protein
MASNKFVTEVDLGNGAGSRVTFEVWGQTELAADAGAFQMVEKLVEVVKGWKVAKVAAGGNVTDEMILDVIKGKPAK